ncbi:hypothetical protein AB3S75_007164 [Citrus x aurantiifolia]
MGSHWHNHQDSKNRQPSKLSRKRLTQDQVRLLETSFNANQKLQVDRKLELARRLGLPPRQIAVWYQNRRAREKIHTIELDYKTIRQELDNVLAENRKLEQEVGMLKHELKKSQQMLLASNPSATLLPSVSTSGDNDLTSSSSPLNITCNWEDTGLLPMDELYSCLIRPQGQPENHSMNDLSIV